MKIIEYESIVRAVESVCLSAAFKLPDDVRRAINKALDEEISDTGKLILKQCLENAGIAEKEQVPICQDTGTAVFFVEIGNEVYIEGGIINDAISEGTERGYAKGYLRKSMVSDPVFNRKNTGDNTPPVIHLEIKKGKKLKITLVPKGGGSENMSALAMLKPFEGEKGIIDFVVSTVKKAGANPCPPTIVGVGIGGTFEFAACLAKKALLRPAGIPNKNKRYAMLEEKILHMLNTSGIGPQGFGGKTTALGVNIEFFPCHIASLPVAVNLNCHAARHSVVEL